MRCQALTRDGSPCGNPSTDATGFCRAHHPDAKVRPSSGVSFEGQVLKTLQLLGYKVRHNVSVHGSQTDVCADIRTGLITIRLLVECKEYGPGRHVGIEEVNKFAGVVAVARNTGVADKGLLVTTTGFTKEARTNAEAAGIQLITYTELSTQLVDFSQYLERLVADYQALPVSNHYVAIAGTHSEEYEGLDSSEFTRPIDNLVDKYLLSSPPTTPRTRIPDERVASVGRDSRSIQVQNASAPSRTYPRTGDKLALLGNFGTGKSTFCRKYAHDLALRFQKDPTQRIPILISLSEFNDRFDIQHLALGTLIEQYGVSITRDLFGELQRQGRFLFILDGLDEMATRVDPETIEDNIREISSLSSIPNNRLLLTCRTHFFRDKVEARRLGDFEVLYIPEWGPTELAEYLQLRYGESWQDRLQTILKTHNLEELARTPLFLEMIVESLPELGAEVERAKLYERYTARWIDVESRRKGARLPAELRREFVMALALLMWREDRPACHYRQFSLIIAEHLHENDATRIDYIRSDVQTCTFLTRDPEGNYAFRHKSFMEFFVAQALASTIRARDSRLLAERILTPEICDFLVEMLRQDAPARTLIEWIGDVSRSALRENSLKLAALLRLESSAAQTSERTPALADDEITSRFLRGDADAFDTVVQRFYPQMRIWARRLVRDPDVVDDVVADALLAVWRAAPQLETVANFRAYLARIVSNTAANYYRKERRHRADWSIDDVVLEADEDDGELYVRDLLRAEEVPDGEPLDPSTIVTLSSALARLGESERAVVQRHVQEGLSFRAIAEEMGVSAATAQRLYAKGIRSLRAELGPQQED